MTKFKPSSLIGQTRESLQGIYDVVAYEHGEMLVQFTDDVDNVYNFSILSVLNDELVG